MSGTTEADRLKASPESGLPKIIPSPASALWNQRGTIAALRDRFKALRAAVNRHGNLSLYQWAEIAAFTLEFRPDLVIELGRERGNSTCCFTEVANRLGGASACRVVSLCLSDDWFKVTLPRVKKVVPSEWFAPAEIRVCNILDCDLTALLANAKRCLVFWDAHGFEVAEWVLSKLLPRLAERTHRVLMHDLSDTRFEMQRPEYGDLGIWKGANAGEPSFVLGHIFSRVAQAISIVDFTTRNELPLHSAAESLSTEIDRDPAKRAHLTEILGSDFFPPYVQAHWFWFTLNEASGALSFPRYTVSEEKRQRETETLLQQLEKSAGWRLLNRWRVVRDHILAEGTRRRRLYNTLLGPLRGGSPRHGS